MGKKLLSHSFKLLKLSTWISAILAVLIVLLVATIVALPALIKAPLETKLSEISNLEVRLSQPSFVFNNGKVSMQIDKLEASTLEHKNLLMVADNLKLELQLSWSLNNIYKSNRIFVDKLIFDLNAIEKQQTKSGVGLTQHSTVLPNLEDFNFFTTLKINKTLVKGKKNIDIAPISINANNKQIILKINGQILNKLEPKTSKVDIVSTITNATSNNAMLNLVLLISSKDFSTTTNMKFINQAGDNVVEIESFLEHIYADKVANYLSPQLIGEDVHDWIKNGFLAGTLQNSKLKFRKNLSKLTDAKLHFSSQLKNMELAFNTKWKSLKKLDASLHIDEKQMSIMVHSTQLNSLPLSGVKVQIDDISQANTAVKVAGKINNKSQHLVEFLKRSPLNAQIHETLNSIALSGQANADVSLVIPLNKDATVVDVDLLLTNNRLSVLNNKIVVKDYDSKVAFHNNKITSVGIGSIHGSVFDIRINPSKQPNDNKHIFSVELVNHGNNAKTHITQRLDKSWHAVVDSKDIKGDVLIIPNSNDVLDVRLLDVQLNNTDIIKGDWKIAPQDLPNMRLSTHNFYVDEVILPNFSVELSSKNNSLEMKNLQIEGLNIDDKAINFSGVWENGTTLVYAKTKGKNLAEFLKQLKIKEKVTGGEFDFDMHLSCKCAPWNMNYQNITGDFDVNVKQGVFTGQDPHIGRILSMLNIKSVVKRLSLSFSDVVDQGFSYDNIKTQIHLQNATAEIQKFNLESSSSNITLTGQSHIVNRQHDLTANVTPAVGDALPIATYLTGGGLTGLTAWIIDEILFGGILISDTVDDVVTFKYQITGSWDKPIIKEKN